MDNSNTFGYFPFQTTKVYRIEKKSVPKAVALRKKWKKFGHAADDGDGPNTAQTMVADEVYLQLTANKEVSARLCRLALMSNLYHASS